MISLLIKEIADTYIRENFQRIANYLKAENPLDGYRKITLSFTKQETISVPHQLGFVPQSVIPLRIEDGATVTFHYERFDSTNVYATASKATKVKALVGA